MDAKRFSFTCAGLLCLVWMRASASGAAGDDQRHLEKLSSVKTIFVASLGRDTGADFVREKLCLELTKTRHFVVLERPDSADAILAGAAGVERSVEENSVTDQMYTTHKGYGVFRLIDSKSEATLWVYEYKQGLMFFGSASSKLARKTVERLVHDVAAAADSVGAQR